MRKDETTPSGRIARPSTAEIRHEVMQARSDSSRDEFAEGIMIALEWVLGERKTLRRTDK